MKGTKATQTKEVKKVQEDLLKVMAELGYDGTRFCDDLVVSINLCKRKGKTQKQIRFYKYCCWARLLKKNSIGRIGSTYTYPSLILKLLRTHLPNQIKGEFREDAYQVTMKEFCQSVMQ